MSEFRETYMNGYHKGFREGFDSARAPLPDNEESGSSEPSTEDVRASLEGRIGIHLGLWDGVLDVGGEWEEHQRFVAHIADLVEAVTRAASAQAVAPGLDVERLAKALVACETYCCEGCVLDIATAYAEADREA